MNTDALTSPWLTLPGIVLSIVTAIVQCQEKQMALEEKKLAQEEATHDTRIIEYLVEKAERCSS